VANSVCNHNGHHGMALWTAGLRELNGDKWDWVAESGFGTPDAHWWSVHLFVLI